MHPEHITGLPPKRNKPQQLEMLPAIASMRKLIWIYFVLLMMEGALRKWLLKSFSEPLLIIRDPVVLLIYYQAFNSGLFLTTAGFGF